MQLQHTCIQVADADTCNSTKHTHANMHEPCRHTQRCTHRYKIIFLFVFFGDGHSGPLSLHHTPLHDSHPTSFTVRIFRGSLRARQGAAYPFTSLSFERLEGMFALRAMRRRLTQKRHLEKLPRKGASSIGTHPCTWPHMVSVPLYGERHVWGTKSHGADKGIGQQHVTLVGFRGMGILTPLLKLHHHGKYPLW